MRLVACGVCHTDLYTASGADPSGYSPTVLGHEGAGVVEKVGEDVTLVAPGDHVVTLFSPAVRRVRPLPQPADEPLPRDPRAAEPGLPARRHDPPLAATASAIRHFMGTSTFAEYTVMPEIALAKVEPGGAARGRRAVRLRALDRARRRDAARPRSRRARPASSSAPALVGLGAVAGCRLQGAERIIAVDLSEDRLELARGQGATDRLARRRHRRADPRDDRRVRRRLHVRGDRQRRRSCARRSSPRAWAGASARSPAWRARARRSTSSRAS